MKAKKNFEKIAILKTGELVSFWGVKTHLSKLIQIGFQVKVKQTKENIIGNKDSADCFKEALIFERICKLFLP